MLVLVGIVADSVVGRWGQSFIGSGIHIHRFMIKLLEHSNGFLDGGGNCGLVYEAIDVLLQLRRFANDSSIRLDEGINRIMKSPTHV